MCQIKNKFLVKDATRKTAYKIMYYNKKNKTCHSMYFKTNTIYKTNKVYTAKGYFKSDNKAFSNNGNLHGSVFHVYTSLKRAKFLLQKLQSIEDLCIVKVYVNDYVASGINGGNENKTACYRQIIFTNETYRK